jgi:serine phosphatase RsbU (regulator of sigma subunit)
MSALNRTLLRRSIDRRFATIAYGQLETDGRLRLTCAGHNPTYLLKADGTLLKLDKGGLMVGIFPDLSYDEDEVVLDAGDRLVLYSDGVTEAENSTTAQYEEERLEDCLRQAAGASPDDTVRIVIDSVRTFADGYAQADDITVLVVRYLGAA